jgi:dinuclear metal center YbgI/SA1388 family protein
MKIQHIISFLETIAPPSLQESYDNAGLIIGDALQECSGMITSLDATEAVVKEAIEKKCNLIVAHHPIIFSGLKKITGKNYVEKAIILAIKNDIAIYAIHTNLDNVIDGVNAKIADKLGLINRKVLHPKAGILKKLYTFVPIDYAEKTRQAIFAVGGGAIGKYAACSFNVAGEGTFLPGADTKPFAGQLGKLHTEKEIKIEVIFNAWQEATIIAALKSVHPYEEVAYDVVPLENSNENMGSGLIGELPKSIEAEALLSEIKEHFKLKMIKHTCFLDKKVKKVAVCGGAGSFLIPSAILAGADFYITSDVKYHEFFDANDKLVIADIGHYESEQFTIGLLFDLLSKKFPNFAVLKTGVVTNPVHYF